MAERDLALYDTITRMLRRLTPFFERLSDTAIAAGFDSYQHALDVYGFAKIASPDQGLKELVKEMSVHFKRNPRTTRVPAEAEA